MKKPSFIVWLICLVFMSCSNITFERKVENNAFISMGDPRMQIQVSPGFKYIGQISTARHHQKIHGSRGLIINYNSYLFADVGEDNTIKRGVIIRVDKINKSYWDSDLFSDVKSKLVSDYEDINAERFEHFVAVRSDIFTQDEMDFVISEGMRNVKSVIYDKKLTYRGYSIPQCFLVEAFGIRTGAGYDTRTCIYYFEDLTSIDEGFSCRDWVKGEMSADDQDRAKRLFIESRKKAVVFSKYKG